MKTRRQKILDTLDDCGGQFVYYDRKEDEDLPQGSVEEAVAAGEITIEEIAEAFIEGTKLRPPGGNRAT